MRNPIHDDDGHRGLAGGNHDAFPPSRSSLLEPRVYQGLILDHFALRFSLPPTPPYQYSL